MLGRCRIFPPTEDMSQHDLRSHTYRVRELFRDPQVFIYIYIYIYDILSYYYSILFYLYLFLTSPQQ